MDPIWTQNGPKMDPHVDTRISAVRPWHTHKRGSPEAYTIKSYICHLHYIMFFRTSNCTDFFFLMKLFIFINFECRNLRAITWHDITWHKWWRSHHNNLGSIFGAEEYIFFHEHLLFHFRTWFLCINCSHHWESNVQWLMTNFPMLWLSLCLCLCLCVSLSVCLSVCLSLSLSVFLVTSLNFMMLRHPGFQKLVERAWRAFFFLSKGRNLQESLLSTMILCHNA